MPGTRHQETKTTACPNPVGTKKWQVLIYIHLVIICILPAYCLIDL